MELDDGGQRGELALLAAQFVLPGRGPDVNAAIRAACDLITGEQDTPATVAVAALRYGMPLRDAEPLIREMLDEQGLPAARPDTSEAENLLPVLRALGTGGLKVGEFFNIFMRAVPAWEHQDKEQRALVILLNDWTGETTPEGRSAASYLWCRHSDALRGGDLTGVGLHDDLGGLAGIRQANLDGWAPTMMAPRTDTRLLTIS